MSRLTTKTPIRKEQNCKRRKDTQHNVQRKNIKWTNNDLQITAENKQRVSNANPTKYRGGSSSYSGWVAVPAPLVTPVVLLLKDTDVICHGNSVRHLYT